MSEAYFTEGSEAQHALEAMVDKVGLRNVVYALASICDGKAEHLAHAWQDHISAKQWAANAARLDKTAHQLKGTGV